MVRQMIHTPLRCHADVALSVPQLGPPVVATAEPAGPPNEPKVYHYKHPITGLEVVSLLPPDHPHIVCMQHGHQDVETRFGPLGLSQCLSFRVAVR